MPIRCTDPSIMSDKTHNANRNSKPTKKGKKKDKRKSPPATGAFFRGGALVCSSQFPFICTTYCSCCYIPLIHFNA